MAYMDKQLIPIIIKFSFYLNNNYNSVIYYILVYLYILN